MIATLSGKVLSKNIDRAVVDVGGVGYEVIVSSDTIARMVDKGEEAFFFIHTNVREDAITLYGFIDEQEKQLFLILKTVSGIGPKLALAMLSGLRVAEICQAIINGDVKRLTTLQGVGKKTAERLCVELKEKVSHLSADISVDRMSEPSLPVGNSGDLHHQPRPLDPTNGYPNAPDGATPAEICTTTVHIAPPLADEFGWIR